MFRAVLLSSVLVTLSTCGNPAPPLPDAGTGGGDATGAGTGTSGGGAAGIGGGAATGGGGGGATEPADGGRDAGAADAGRDAGGPDAGFDAGVDAGFDAGLDAGLDAGPARPDGGLVVRFVAIGDQGKGNPAQFAVGAAIGTHCATEGCDFVVLLGDNFYPSGVDSTMDMQWQTAFVDPYATVNVPFYAVLGNHDYGANGAGTDLPKGDNEVAYSTVNTKWRMPSHHFKWSFNHVDFFASDTNRSMLSVDQAVRSDFNTWLPASTAQWKIVFGHHTYKSNGEHGNAGNYDGLSFVPIINGAGVKSFVEERVCGLADFYMNGHDHDIEWMQATCSRTGSSLQTGIIISGGGASTTPIVGNQPTYYSTDQAGFVYVVIRDNTFTATFYDSMGVQKYTRTVTK